jgi:hypothetical protein
MKVMKRFLSLFIIALAFVSCQEDLKTNDPGLQALKDDAMWRANDTRAYLSTNGNLRIEAYTEYELVTLNTSSANEGTYILGSTNTSNAASYSANYNDVDLEYATASAPGPVYTVALNAGGSGYFSDCDLQTDGSYACDSSHNTTGGSGSGLAVALVANSAGVVTSVVRITARGNGYLPGDIVTVSQGNLNCKLQIINVQNSNGEIEITDYDNLKMTVTGKFKFNAISIDTNPFGGPVINFQYGDFYNIPIYPDL